MFSEWQCPITKVNILSKAYKPYYITSYLLFEVSRNKMFVPCDFLDFIYDNLLKEAKCTIITYNNKRRIQCGKLSDKISMDKMIFYIGDGMLAVSLSNLFSCYTESICDSLFKCEENKNTFIFTGAILRLLTSTFDYEDKAVYLYSDGQDIEVNPENIIKILFSKNVIMNIYKILSVILILMSLFIFDIKKRQLIMF